jgi:hypothetical protein
LFVLEVGKNPFHFSLGKSNKLSSIVVSQKIAFGDKFNTMILITDEPNREQIL